MRHEQGKQDVVTYSPKKHHRTNLHTRAAYRDEPQGTHDMKIAAICWTMLAGALMADGLPIDHETGKIMAPHVTVKINADQQHEVTVLQSLTLNAEQWHKVRQSAPACPKRITEVFPHNYNDCMCGHSGPAIAIQMKPDEVAILLWGVDGDSSKNLRAFAAEGRQLKLSMDKRGQFHHQGRLVKYPDVLEALKNMKRGRHYMSLDIPLEMKRNSPTLKTRIDTVEVLATEAGWSMWIY